MIIEMQQYAYNGKEMKLIFKKEKKLNKFSISKELENFYKYNPYAKRIEENWICGDYRIDQQRPQRNVYSEYYIKVVSITEIEKPSFDRVVNELEKNIEYPTVWDDGENIHYEETIYCPKCGKRRKVLTSKTHCEFCGFEFSKAKKCPECKSLNLEDNKYCTKCNHKFFEEKEKIKEDEKLIGDNIIILGCEDKKQCPKCKEWVDVEEKFCGYCGEKLTTFIKCVKCGKENKSENNYCNYCGSELIK